MSEDLIKLIDQAKDNSQIAFTKLYQNYNKLIWSVIYSIVKNSDVADDLTSIAFTKAFMNLTKYVDYISFEMWLKKIATNTAIDYIRKMQDEQLNCYLDADDNFVQLPIDLDPETEMLHNESVDGYREALDLLKSDQQQVLKLRYGEGLAYREIADKLNIPIGTIKSLIHKGKKNLIKSTTNHYKHGNNLRISSNTRGSTAIRPVV